MHVDKWCIRKSTLLIFLSYWFVFIQLPYFPKSESSLLIKISTVITIGFLIPFVTRKILKKTFFSMNLLLLLFLIFIMISGVKNAGTLKTVYPPSSSFLIAARIIGFFLLIEYLVEKQEILNLISVYSTLTLILVIINDFLIIGFPGLTASMNPLFFIGNKFSVVYSHLQLMALLMMKQSIENGKWNRNIIVGVAVLSAIISFKVECITGLIGLLLFIVFYILISSTKRLVYNPVVFMAILAGSSLFVVLYEVVLLNPYVQTLITTVLKRSLTLTGRTYIYANIFNVLKNHWLWGYGYGSSYEVCVKYLYYADTQNGILEWILQTGIFVTAIIIIIIVLVLIKCSKNTFNRKKTISILALLYAFSILSSIEITIDMNYFMLLGILYGWSLQSEDQNKYEELPVYFKE